MASSTDSPAATLTAAYTSPQTAHTFTTPLQSLPASNLSTADKTSYIADLRTKVTQLQADLNAFLTERMEEDKAREAGSGGATRRTKDEEREEEMYGEEDPEKDG